MIPLRRLFLFPALLLAEEKISAKNSTAGWRFPYKASAERSAKIAEGEKPLKAPVPYKDVIKLLGKPDTVTDLRAHFSGYHTAKTGFSSKIDAGSCGARCGISKRWIQRGTSTTGGLRCIWGATGQRWLKS